MPGRIRITAAFLQEFYEEMGRYQMDLEIPEGSTVRDLIEIIDREVKPGFKSMVLDERGEVRYPREIAVNGRRIDFLDGLDTKLKDGDRVVFSPRVLFVV